MWRRDHDNAPTGERSFFLVRPVYRHQGTSEVCLPSIVQQIDGKLYAPDNEIDPLVFGEHEPIDDWRAAGIEWAPLPPEWLEAPAARSKQCNHWPGQKRCEVCGMGKAERAQAEKETPQTAVMTQDMDG